MYKVTGWLAGLALVVGAAYATVTSLTESQYIPPARGRLIVSSAPAVGELPRIELLPQDVAPTPLEEYRATLREADRYLRSVETYTATFIRRIRKDGELRDLEEIEIKVRHQPFSVYMKWKADGLQVLYVDGENDGRLLAKRAQGFFRRTMRLGPTSRLAMDDSRYPVYELGMLALVENAQEALDACPSDSGVRCAVETTEIDGVPVRQFTITFDSPSVQDTYSECVFCFSDGHPLPVCITSCGWTPEGEPDGLLEHYYYRDIQLEPGLTDLDFDAENDEYGF